MEKEIKLQKNDDNRDWSDLEWIDEFYCFLQGENPEKITWCEPMNLTPEQAFTVIRYLQEHFPVFPDRIEKCDVCDRLLDTWSEGYYCEQEGKHYCDACTPDLMYCENCDRNKRLDCFSDEDHKDRLCVSVCLECKQLKNEE